MVRLPGQPRPSRCRLPERLALRPARPFPLPLFSSFFPRSFCGRCYYCCWCYCCWWCCCRWCCCWCWCCCCGCCCPPELLPPASCASTMAGLAGTLLRRLFRVHQLSPLSHEKVGLRRFKITSTRIHPAAVCVMVSYHLSEKMVETHRW